MRATLTHAVPPSRAVGAWLLVLAVLTVGQVLLGGVTRLTGSGLSITEWRPVTGVVPPLDDAAWERAFAAYREIPQFTRVNPHFTLADFKRIYFWEWLHRLWGRLIGLCFLAPLPVLARKGLLRGRARSLGALLALGLGQGVLGWLMVASGLTERAYVSHIRLALHLAAALVLLGATVWLALGELAVPPPGRRARAPKALLALLGLQLVYGAFMAGLHAAPAAPTWPTLNGLWFPRGTFESLEALTDDPLTVQLVHRTLAYALGALVLVEWLRRRGGPRAVRHAPLAAVGVQLALGVATVLSAGEASFLPLALAHQLAAVLLFVALVVLAWFAR